MTTRKTKIKNFFGTRIAALHGMTLGLIQKKSKGNRELSPLEALSRALRILIPGLRKMENVIKKNKILPAKEEVHAIEALLEVFNVLNMLEQQHGLIIKEIAGISWFKTACQDAKLLYDKTIAHHNGDEEGLMLKHSSGRYISLHQMHTSTSRSGYIKNIFDSMRSLIGAVYQLEEKIKTKAVVSKKTKQQFEPAEV